MHSAFFPIYGPHSCLLLRTVSHPPWEKDYLLLSYLFNSPKDSAKQVFSVYR